MKSDRRQSGQSMIPILIIAGAILTTVLIASQNLTNGTQSAKTAQLTAETDMLSTEVYQVINSPESCSLMIQNGDGFGGTPVKYHVSAAGVPPVVPIQTGLTFDGTKPFLVHGDYVNSLVIPSPTPPYANLRFDPKGFVDYGLQNTGGTSKFAGKTCYLVNLHVEAQNPQRIVGSKKSSQLVSYGNQLQTYDFPIYIGVNAAFDVQACQGASGGSPCVTAIPVVVPSPADQCATLGGSASLDWSMLNASYGILQGVGSAVYGPVQVPTSGPTTVPVPGSGAGPFQYTLTPYSTAGTPGNAYTFNVELKKTPKMLSCLITPASPGNASIAWTGDSHTTYVDVVPAPGPSQPPSSPPGYTIPAPASGTVFTCTPYNQCGAGTPLTTTYAGSASPSPSVSPSVSPTVSPTPTPTPTLTPPPIPSITPSPTPSPSFSVLPTCFQFCTVTNDVNLMGCLPSDAVCPGPFVENGASDCNPGECCCGVNPW